MININGPKTLPCGIPKSLVRDILKFDSFLLLVLLCR